MRSLLQQPQQLVARAHLQLGAAHQHDLALGILADHHVRRRAGVGQQVLHCVVVYLHERDAQLHFGAIFLPAALGLGGNALKGTRHDAVLLRLDQRG